MRGVGKRSRFEACPISPQGGKWNLKGRLVSFRILPATGRNGGWKVDNDGPNV